MRNISNTPPPGTAKTDRREGELLHPCAISFTGEHWPYRMADGQMQCLVCLEPLSADTTARPQGCALCGSVERIIIDGRLLCYRCAQHKQSL